VVIWLLMDPADVDSKQTTSVRRDGNEQGAMAKLYRLDSSLGFIRLNSLPGDRRSTEEVMPPIWREICGFRHDPAARQLHRPKWK